MAIDNVLKLYSETIRSPYLHYGFWDQPETLSPDRLTLEDIRQAQERYIDHLAGFIPVGVKLILDVGCGIGGNSAYLTNKGFQVEALSPDSYQEETIRARFQGQLPFYHTKFEAFKPTKQYDLILQSESACYIKIRPGFQKAREALTDGGYLLVSDYFVHQSNGESPHLKSSHALARYLEIAAEEGFDVIRQFDQTANTMPTLDAARNFVERFIKPTLGYTVTVLEKKRPLLLRLLKGLVNRFGRDKLKQLELIDSVEFCKYRKYMIFLFQKRSA